MNESSLPGCLLVLVYGRPRARGLLLTAHGIAAVWTWSFVECLCCSILVSSDLLLAPSARLNAIMILALVMIRWHRTRAYADRDACGDAYDGSHRRYVVLLELSLPP